TSPRAISSRSCPVGTGPALLPVLSLYTHPSNVHFGVMCVTPEGGRPLPPERTGRHNNGRCRRSPTGAAHPHQLESQISCRRTVPLSGSAPVPWCGRGTSADTVATSPTGRYAGRGRERINIEQGLLSCFRAKPFSRRRRVWLRPSAATS